MDTYETIFAMTNDRIKFVNRKLMKMKNLLKVIVPAVVVMFSFSSCDKDNTTTTPTTPTTTTPTTPTAPTPPTPAVTGNYWGMMAAIQMKFSYTTPQLPTPVSITSDIGVAAFYSSKGNGNTLESAGTVSVNGNALDMNTNNSYTLTATMGLTPSSLSLGSNVKWEATGSTNVNSLTYTHQGAFPDFTGTVPTSIDKSKDLTISLGSKLTGADSVYIVIVTSSNTLIKRFGGNASSATISATDLGTLPTVTDGTAYFEVVPFNYTTSTLNGKEYVFIKEAAVVSTVDIN